MADEVLTYVELAERLGVKPDSARKLVRRRRWKRIQGNDGIVRTVVPEGYLSGPRVSPVDTSHTIATLEAQVQHLRELLAMAEQDRDRWHALAIRPWWRRLAG